MKLDLRIDWSEMDMFGHVNNLAFFKYIQAGRVNYWEKCGISDLHEKENIAPILASVKMDFRKPLYYPGNIIVVTEIDFIKNTSFGFKHIIHDKEKNFAAQATDIMVLFDFNKNQKVNFPEEIRKRIEKLREG